MESAELYSSSCSTCVFEQNLEPSKIPFSVVKTTPEEIKMGSVELYSTNCPKCIMLKQKLESSKIPFSVVKTTPEEIKEKGFNSVPLLLINGTEWLTFDEAIKWIQKKKK